MKFAVLSKRCVPGVLSRITRVAIGMSAPRIRDLVRCRQGGEGMEGDRYVLASSAEALARRVVR